MHDQWLVGKVLLNILRNIVLLFSTPLLPWFMYINTLVRPWCSVTQVTRYLINIMMHTHVNVHNQIALCCMFTQATWLMSLVSLEVIICYLYKLTLVTVWKHLVQFGKLVNYWKFSMSMFLAFFNIPKIYSGCLLK